MIHKYNRLQRAPVSWRLYQDIFDVLHRAAEVVLVCDRIAASEMIDQGHIATTSVYADDNRPRRVVGDGGVPKGRALHQSFDHARGCIGDERLEAEIGHDQIWNVGKIPPRLQVADQFHVDIGDFTGCTSVSINKCVI
jgi:hypothetical protein